MSIIKEIRWKDKSGKTVDYDVGVKASNVEQDASHRFVTDAEKQAWNGKPSADTQNLKTYTSLTQLEVSTPATMVQIYNALPENSYLLMNMENNNMVSDIPTGNGSGVLEVTKAGTARNFARYTPSLSTAGEAKGMYYGTFSWSGEAVFNGWKLLLDETRIANNDTTTQAGFAADARIVKTHGDEIDQLNSELTANNNKFYFDFQNDQYGYNTDPARGADTFHPFRGKLLIPNFTLINDDSGKRSYFEIDISNYHTLYVPAISKQVWQQLIIRGYTTSGSSAVLYDTGIGAHQGPNSFDAKTINVISYVKLRFEIYNITFTVGGFELS